MPQHDKTTLEGAISEVFAHRLVLRTANGSALADLGPKLAGRARPKRGDTVKLTGEQKPSELKVTTFERDGEIIEAEKRDGDGQDDHTPAEPTAALSAKGHKVVAVPHRKPKHFEILAKDSEGAHHEHHVGLDGEIRKTKKGDPAHKKWKPLAPEAA